MSDPKKPQDDDHGVVRGEIPSAEGQAASTGSEASTAYGEGSIQILEGLEAVRIDAALRAAARAAARILSRVRT